MRWSTWLFGILILIGLVLGIGPPAPLANDSLTVDNVIGIAQDSGVSIDAAALVTTANDPLVPASANMITAQGSIEYNEAALAQAADLTSNVHENAVMAAASRITTTTTANVTAAPDYTDARRATMATRPPEVVNVLKCPIPGTQGAFLVTTLTAETSSGSILDANEIMRV